MNKLLVLEIISTYDEYVKLLSDEIETSIGLAIAHGYTGNETAYQKGVELREKIEKIKKLVEKL